MKIRKKKSLGGSELVRADSFDPPPLILRAQNIGSHYVSPQWRLAPIHDFHHDILLGTLHNAQRQPSFYGDAAAPYTAKPTD